MLAFAVDSEEVETRLDKPPRGRHKTEAYIVRDAYFYQRDVKHNGQLSIRRFALMVGKSYTAVNNWLDGKSHIRSDSMARVRKLSPPASTVRPEADSNVTPLDPASGRSYDRPTVQNEGDAMERDTSESRVVADLLNRIEDHDLRYDAMDVAREAIKRFLSTGAGNAGQPPPAQP